MAITGKPLRIVEVADSEIISIPVYSQTLIAMNWFKSVRNTFARNQPFLKDILINKKVRIKTPQNRFMSPPF